MGWVKKLDERGRLFLSLHSMIIPSIYGISQIDQTNDAELVKYFFGFFIVFCKYDCRPRRHEMPLREGQSVLLLHAG